MKTATAIARNVRTSSGMVEDGIDAHGQEVYAEVFDVRADVDGLGTIVHERAFPSRAAAARLAAAIVTRGGRIDLTHWRRQSGARIA